MGEGRRRARRCGGSRVSGRQHVRSRPPGPGADHGWWGAYLTDQPHGPIDAVKEASAEPLRGEEVNNYWVARRQDGSPAAAAVPDAVGLIDGALAGYLLARHLDDGRAADYRVVFEENAQGALRARMQLFRVLEVPGEKPRTVAEGGYVDASGHLAGIPAPARLPVRSPS